MIKEIPASIKWPLVIILLVLSSSLDFVGEKQFPLNKEMIIDNQLKATQNHIMNEKILFIHGFPMSKKIWKSQINELSGTHYCTAVDLPGYGDRAASKNFIHSIDSYADFVKQYIEENNLGRVHIIAMSMGGSIALNMSRRYPEIIASIALIHTSAVADTHDEKQNRNKTIADIENGGLAEFIEFFADRLLSPDASSETKRKYISDMMEASEETVIAGYKAIRDRADEFSHLKRLEIPVLLVAGSDDVGSSPEEMKSMANEIRNSTFEIIEGCGHVAPLEKPEVLNQILVDWISKQE
ncbi:MAG: alpha/beta fold hydrolase [Ekhidna sp.]